jgi:hypothetical protein
MTTVKKKKKRKRKNPPFYDFYNSTLCSYVRFRTTKKEERGKNIYIKK